LTAWGDRVSEELLGEKEINQMPPAARLGDKAMCAADAHGCIACPHVVTGPAIQGSTDVMINYKPALRKGDAGIHAPCCGPNRWTASAGSGTVMINGKPAVRLGDGTDHCGGKGNLIEGSPNVNVGG
jgi:uncharacterized Zn-binding protein involved in type VI secretion